MGVSVDLQVATDSGELPTRHDLQSWVDAVLERNSGELTIRIVDEAESRELNRRYRGRDQPTNVLSFPVTVPPEVDLDLALLGDLVICAPAVAREAEQQGKPLGAHWAHLVVHGILHLLGYDHAEPAEAVRMERREVEILGRLGYENPYE